ncbi:MAG: glycosyl hydrolase family 28-related protein [Eubacteriales bacterium]|nr:glycosyl hydrolase family 28-related protein [Eubacteriales bacterium]
MKKSSYTCIFVVCTILLTALASSCASTKLNDGMDGSEVSSLSSITDSTVITAKTMSELRSVPSVNENSIIVLKGYYKVGDGAGGLFFWDPESTAPDNGGTVIKINSTDVGRLIRIHEENSLNVKWFGAKGNGSGDDYLAIQSAIDALPIYGGTVSLPGGTYPVSSPIVIGNGDGGEGFSTRNGIKLIGEGGGFATWTNVPTQIIATAVMDSVIDVKGRISDCYIQSLYINGGSKAKNGLTLTAISGCIISNLKIIQFTEKGLVLMGGQAPTGNYNIFNRFESISSVTTLNNTTCLFIDGDYSATNDTWLTTFIDCRFDTHTTTNSVAAHFKFVDSISFYRCHFAKYDESSTGVIFDALDNHDYPCGMAFYDCSIVDTKVLEDSTHQIRKNYFYGFGTYDNEKVPPHNKLIGITDEGIPFNMPAISGGTIENGKLPAMTGLFDTYSNAEFSWINLNEPNSTVAIKFNAGGEFTGGKFYFPSFDDNTGTINLSVYKWNEDYETTISKNPVYTTAFVDFEDNSWQNFSINSNLTPGEYLIVLHDCTDVSFGVGVWTKGSGVSVTTYQNGSESDFGIIAQLQVK